MRVIGYHILNGFVINSDGESATENLLDFLIEYKPDTIKVFYNLDYAVANLFKWLNIDDKSLRKLINTQELYIPPYKFGYMSKKYFNVQYGGGKGKGFANFSDMYQFHRNSDMTDLEPHEYAKTAQDIGQQVYEALHKLELNPTSLTSPVRCWEKEVISQIDIPTLDDIPEPAAKMAYNCCDGGWVEAFQKGHYDKTWDYDMRSAYGSFTRNLLDTRAGKWINTELYDPACYYGFALCDIEITAPFSPIPYINKGKDSEELTPIGKWRRCLTKQHIDFILKYRLGNIDIIDGWWWFPDKLVYPFESMIDYLYQAKETAKTAIEKDVVKRILAGIWGKFLQVNRNARKDDDPFGALFNPVWAAQVETGCRLTTAAFVLDNHLEKNVLHVAVDGALTNRPVPVMETGAIGEWKLSGTGKAFVLSSGICALESRDMPVDEPDGKENGDFVLRYGWLLDQIMTMPNSPEYTLDKLSPVTIQKAVTHGKMAKLGQHEEIVKTVDITFETKREYDRLPETGAQLMRRHYMSKPKDLNAIAEIRECVE